MHYHDLRDFIAQLEKQGELKRVSVEVSPNLEMTEICNRVLKAQGPAICSRSRKVSTSRVLGNLFGTPGRVAMGMGEESVAALKEIANCWPTSGSRTRRRDSRTPGTSCRC